MFYYFFDFVFELIVVLLDKLKSMFLILFETTVYLQKSFNFFFFGINHMPQNIEVILIKLSKISFPLIIGLSFLSELAIVVLG